MVPGMVPVPWGSFSSAVGESIVGPRRDAPSPMGGGGPAHSSQSIRATSLTMARSSPTGRATLTFTSGGRPRRTRGTGAAPRILLSIGVDAVDKTLGRVTTLGGSVGTGPNKMPWGQRVAHIQDPDGNPVNLTQPIPAGRTGPRDYLRRPGTSR